MIIIIIMMATMKMIFDLDDRMAWIWLWLWLWLSLLWLLSLIRP